MKNKDRLAGYRTCFHCMHKISQWPKDEYGFPDVSKPLEHDCAAGHTQRTQTWWGANGHKKDPEPRTQMPCFEETEHSRKLGKLLDAGEEFMETLLDALKSIKKDESKNTASENDG